MRSLREPQQTAPRRDCDEDGQIIDHVTRTGLETFGLTPDAAGMREAFLTHRCFAIADTGFMSELVEGEAALELWEKQGMKGAGSFPVNPALSRFMVATAKREDGSFVVDAHLHRRRLHSAQRRHSRSASRSSSSAPLTLPEFVVKTSVNPARHLRLHDRGHLSEGAAADITVFDYDRQQAVETIVAGKSVMKNGEITGTGITLVTTKAGIPVCPTQRAPSGSKPSSKAPNPQRYIP